MKPSSGKRKRVSKARLASRLRPIQPVTVVAPEGLAFLSQQEVTPANVGHKAYGLASLPPGWTQPFFVVDSRCNFFSDADLNAAARRLRSVLREAVEQLGALPGSLLIVRSSGSAETLSRRGSLQTATCRVDQLAATLRQLNRELLGLEKGGESQQVHWVIQLKIARRQQGHLSNERRLREEPRDWIVEYELHNAEFIDVQLEHLAVRQWRDGAFSPSDQLQCRYSTDLPDVLKQVAQWGMQFTDRIHFEWVWNGSFLYVVQADVEETSNGVDPRTLVPKQLTIPGPAEFKVFRAASANDFVAFLKLKNAAQYREFGYTMPPFYVLDDQQIMQKIINGELPGTVFDDLAALTSSPLILRVDGTSVPTEKREMLPRSDELRSAESARSWLRDGFASQVLGSGLEDSGLCIIAHHFIPAVASAWARAEPSERWVRIESLWGVPEGLYWYSHDTFEVDTLTADPVAAVSLSQANFIIRERRRFKGNFVAPNAKGEWIAHSTKPPFDWRRSIKRDSWLREIAATTRKIAIEENEPISVMWLIDIELRGVRHSILPWYHSRSDYAGEVRAAPKRKISSHRDFTVRDRSDWQTLRSLSVEQKIDRVTVEPLDADLIRNREFADNIAELARNYGFVVELAGGVLSHIYYVLTRHGCNVECIDLFGADEEKLVFNKIVRDQIPDQISKGGERAEVRRLDGAALELALKRKLVEEALEVLDATETDDVRGELADVLEVVFAIGQRLGITNDEIESERARKNTKRGGFDRGLMLVQTSTPHSIKTHESLELKEEMISPMEGLQALDGPIQTPGALSTKLAVKHDRRTVSGSLEKLISFSTEMSALESQRGAMTFSLPAPGGEHGPEVTLEIEIRRSRNEIKGTIRMRAAPSQFVFEFDL